MNRILSWWLFLFAAPDEGTQLQSLAFFTEAARSADMFQTN